MQPTAAVIFSLLDIMRTRQVVEPINVLTSPLVDLINFRTHLIKHKVERTKKKFKAKNTLAAGGVFWNYLRENFQVFLEILSHATPSRGVCFNTAVRLGCGVLQYSHLSRVRLRRKWCGLKTV